MLRRNPLEWLGSIGAVLALLAPKGLCPLCVAASGGALASIGLGFLAVNSVIHWVLPITLALGLLGLFSASRRHRRWWVFALGVVGSLALYGGWLLSFSPVLYGGMALLIAASAFNFWSQRHPWVPLVQLSHERTVRYGKA